MKVLAASEHFFPRVGGTVNYVHETLCALHEKGVQVELIVPGPKPQNCYPSDVTPPPYSVVWIEAHYSSEGEPGREQRYNFCREVNQLVKERINSHDKPDILHVLFGLFLMEILDTNHFRSAGVPCVATVHNVPPMECALVGTNASVIARAKENLRLKVVGFKNRTRLQKNAYDLYVTPSDQVSALLSPIVNQRIEVIGHGQTSYLQGLMTPPKTRRPSGTEPVKLLTVGGYAPHKRQHIIPETADRIRAAGLNFVWDVVGPSGRVPGYYASIMQEVAARGLHDHVILHEAVSRDKLALHYDNAHLYIQPSTEEGFCLTALDAATTGLPVIGCPAGALPKIVECSGGELVQSDARPLATAITNFLINDQWRKKKMQPDKLKQIFSWEKASICLYAQYRICLRS